MMSVADRKTGEFDSTQIVRGIVWQAADCELCVSSIACVEWCAGRCWLRTELTSASGSSKLFSKILARLSVRCISACVGTDEPLSDAGEKFGAGTRRAGRQNSTSSLFNSTFDFFTVLPIPQGHNSSACRRRNFLIPRRSRGSVTLCLKLCGLANRCIETWGSSASQHIGRRRSSAGELVGQKLSCVHTDPLQVLSSNLGPRGTLKM